MHIVRDGRAVANALLQMPGGAAIQGPTEWEDRASLPEGYREEWESSGRSFVVLAGLEWKMLIDASERAKAEVPTTQAPTSCTRTSSPSRGERSRRSSPSWGSPGRTGSRRGSLGTRSGRLGLRPTGNELSAFDVDALERSLAGHL